MRNQKTSMLKIKARACQKSQLANIIAFTQKTDIIRRNYETIFKESFMRNHFRTGGFETRK